MAANINDFDISKTFSNVILSNVDAQPDTEGVPYDLSTEPYRAQAKLQDGLGHEIPILVSRTCVELEVAPTSPTSILRKQEMMEGITYFQTQSLILG